MKVGLLPLYIKLYDDVNPKFRTPLTAFLQEVEEKFSALGLELTTAPICRVAAEFQAACALFIKEDVCCIITLHLAYSPSLEAIDALAACKKPLLILDTTPSYHFRSVLSADEIMKNHGIHGVQDLCNLLHRHRLPYFLLCGHLSDPQLLTDSVKICKSAWLAQNFRRNRVGIVGDFFEGMGDFQIDTEKLEKLCGITVKRFSLAEQKKHMDQLADEDILAETRADLARYQVKKINKGNHEQAAKSALALRHWTLDQALTALSVNFLSINESSALTKVPFLELCKCMERGLGYAGEGDIVTAALLATVLQLYPESTFSEMFCPDWAENLIFLSHMGEFNPRICEGKPTLSDLAFPYTDKGDTVSLHGSYQAGHAILMNISPLHPLKENMQILLTEVEIQKSNAPSEAGFICGWMKPKENISSFLCQYSNFAGTHHIVIVYGGEIEVLKNMSTMLGFETYII